MIPGKKNFSVILVVLLALLLIAFVIWIYSKKMQETSKKMHQSLAKEGGQKEMVSYKNPAGKPTVTPFIFIN